MADSLPWLSVAILGAFHGLNPGMGWLFAVALGLQERSRAAVLRALGPIAVGHAISIAVVALLVAVLQHWIAPTALKTLGGGALLAFGGYRLLARGGHIRWVGLRVTGRDLGVWSFLMATAHGAGLMLVPFLLRLNGDATVAVAEAAHPHADATGASALYAVYHGVDVAAAGGEIVAVAIHTAAMLLVMGAIALVVFEKLGLAILRRAWVNVDRLWAGGLIGAGAMTLLA